MLDPRGKPLPSTVVLASDAGAVEQRAPTDAAGMLDASRLPFGLYQVTVERAGFLPATTLVALDSALPVAVRLQLQIETAGAAVQVSAAADTLLDAQQAGALDRVGQSAIENRAASLPGRSLVDLVDEQPGWLYEGNAVLHPRGSEYGTQFVVDGVPFTDNRSPGANVQLDAEEVQSMNVYTAGFPAEYGRKLGGVVELNTTSDPREGLHGTTELSGGSFSTAGGYAGAQYGWAEKNVASVSADGAYTAWFENPPVLANYTNTGTTGDFAARYGRDFSPDDRLSLSARHELARFLVPNEQVQEQAGQHEDRDTLETAGTAAYQHIFSPRALADVYAMVRDDTTHLASNAASTPILAAQDRGFRESYAKATVTADRGHGEWKAGAEADFLDLHEQFADTITDPTQFDPGTPSSFRFAQRGRDREQAAFVEDTLHAGRWNLSAGLRWDHYRLLVDEQAVSPRVSLARFFPGANLLAHLSYDRVFQTPAFENILLSSSPAAGSLNPNFLRLPVHPSHGNDYEAGISEGLGSQLRLDANGYVRTAENYADDDQLLDTAVSFPIAFRKARIYGAEAKLELPHWKGFSGFGSYSYLVGSAYLPVTGGLFLGDEASAALNQTSGRFWVSQDQRNTVRARLRYQLAPRVWVAGGAESGSGLPPEFDGDYPAAVAEYGAALVNRVNFARNRVRPSLAADASVGADLIRAESRSLRVQVDGENLNNRLNLIDFAGLFSGNAVAPPRSWSARLRWSF